MAVEIRRVADESVSGFFKQAQREARTTLWGFAVVWHEQSHDVAAVDGDTLVGATRVRIAASLAHIEAVIVTPAYRRQGIARKLLEAIEEIANYYNCHKMTIEVPHRSAAQTFLERCGYKEEAVLPQHTWKIDHAVLRKFLL
ncbi:MAG: GNAT family N-acetyltransferase [Candidatus Eremiobacteraeota bacterium]|nr:GNAT family N-acetyltransferase [Candidatus Eremiobacteraeota bacterium]